MEDLLCIQDELSKLQKAKAELAVLKKEQAAAVGLHAAAQQEIEQLKEQIKADKATIEQQAQRMKKDEALHNSYYEALDAQGLICGVCFESEQQLFQQVDKSEAACAATLAPLHVMLFFC
jgi:chromosome segregation ATPase